MKKIEYVIRGNRSSCKRLVGVLVRVAKIIRA